MVRPAQGGIGVVIRDISGTVLLAAWRAVQQVGDAEEIEALAVKEGFHLAADDEHMRGRRSMIETDCSSVCMLLQRPKETDLGFVLS
jgi:hypothetical protein